MTHDQVKKTVVKNVLTSYLRIVVRMLLGLVTFRLLYQGLTREEFGFWSLLWAVFAYGILLDFGFGYSAQKRVAELSVKQDWAELSRVLSTIFFFYFIMAGIAVPLAMFFSGPLIVFFKVSVEHREEYRHVMMVFLAGIGIAFPFGIFPEVLQGQQRTAAWNNVIIFGAIANFIAVGLAVLLHWGFMALVILSLLCFLVPYFVAAHMALKSMPGVKIRPSLFSRRSIIETSRFSLYAYANTLGNVLRNKTDQPVISTILGVAEVTPYQAGSKVGEMFGMFTRQIGDVLSPTAAHLHAKGEATALREMMLNGMRFSILAATPLCILTMFYMDGLIRVLTGLKQPTAPMLYAGELLVFWYYSLALTHSVVKNMFMMSGQEKKMMLQGVSEAALNLLLSIGLTLWLKHSFGTEWGILGVALGSVIPTFVFGWGLLWGWAARAAQLTRWQLFRRVVFPAVRGCLPMIGVALALRLQPFWASGHNTFLMLAESSVVAAAGAFGVWRIGLMQIEREKLIAKFGGKFGFKPKPNAS